MLRKLLAAIVGCALCMGQMCGAPVVQPDPTPPCLTLADILNIPPGNGAGTGFSGLYHPVSIVEEECIRCERDTGPDSRCDPPVVYPDQRSMFTQSDGTLTVTSDNSPTQSGAINSDGTFKIGAVVTLTTTEGTNSGQGLVLFEGRFVGNRIVATMKWRMTGNQDTGVIDLQQVSTCVYERVP